MPDPLTCPTCNRYDCNGCAPTAATARETCRMAATAADLQRAVTARMALERAAQTYRAQRRETLAESLLYVAAALDNAEMNDLLDALGE